MLTKERRVKGPEKRGSLTAFTRVQEVLILHWEKGRETGGSEVT